MATNKIQLENLPKIGKLRFSQIAAFIGVSREKWRLMGLAGTAPPRVRLGLRCTLWDAGEVHKWIENPMDYKPPSK